MRFGAAVWTRPAGRASKCPVGLVSQPQVFPPYGWTSRETNCTLSRSHAPFYSTHSHQTCCVFRSPRTLAPRSWNVCLARTTGISLAPCSRSRPEKRTAPCPPSRRTPPCCLAGPLLHAPFASPGTASALCRERGTICLWGIWRRKESQIKRDVGEATRHRVCGSAELLLTTHL